MNYTVEELTELELLLLRKREELQSIAASTSRAAEPVALDQTRVGRLSRMDALQGQAMAQESVRRQRIELQRVSLALARLRESDYGFCLSCGESISLQRLRVDPCATQCVDCASIRERT